MKLSKKPKWQTWNVRSLLSHVKLPEAFSLSLGFFEYADCKYLRESLIGRPPNEKAATTANDLPGHEEVHTGPRLVDAHYTDLTLSWQGLSVRIQSACEGVELYLLVEPIERPENKVLLTMEAGVLWNRPGGSRLVKAENKEDSDHIELFTGKKKQQFFASTKSENKNFFPATGAHMAFSLNKPIAISSKRGTSLSDVKAALRRQKKLQDKYFSKFKGNADLVKALSTSLAWTTFYNAGEEKLTPSCSRVWASRNGGGIIFNWDTYMYGMMHASLGHKEYALASIKVITDTIKGKGYIPNVHNAVGSETTGHSQPPVSAMMLRYVAESFDDYELCEPFLKDLLRYNAWWLEKRLYKGFLCWGSNKIHSKIVTRYEKLTGNLQGARFESGLDNSSMYDDVSFDEKTELMLLADVGLMSLYIKDSLDLALLFESLGKNQAALTVRKRASLISEKLESLWNDELGIYCNLDLKTGQFSTRLSPTNFYPLLTGQVPENRARRMIQEHLLNPKEFWGDYPLPSSPYNDPAFPEQSYWRGRVWAPLNLFVYWGLKLSGFSSEAKALAEKSKKLFLKNWESHGYVGENYNAITGECGEVRNSDAFNVWGAILVMPALWEAKQIPELPKNS